MNTDQMRILCRHIIDTMPDDGREDTLSTLRDYLEFYSTQKPPQPMETAATDEHRDQE